MPATNPHLDALSHMERRLRAFRRWSTRIAVFFAVLFAMALILQVEVTFGRPLGNRVRLRVGSGTIEAVVRTGGIRYSGWSFRMREAWIPESRVLYGPCAMAREKTGIPLVWLIQYWPFFSCSIEPNITRIEWPMKPMLFVLAFIAWGSWIPIAFLQRRERLRLAAGACPKCEYPIKGLPDGAACPECGHRERLIEEDRSK